MKGMDFVLAGGTAAATGLIVAIVTVILVYALPGDSETTSCRFALDFGTSQLLSDQKARDTFTKLVFKTEANFMKTIGYHNITGLTMDGQKLDWDTGLPLGDPHNWTASSKECMQFVILARVLWGDLDARSIYTVEEAIEILTKKMDTYEKFMTTYPGFGNWLPWVFMFDDGNVTPTNDFQTRTPALDNGEMFWPMWAATQILKDKYAGKYDALASRYEAYMDVMITNTKKMFWDDTYKAPRTEAHTANMSQPVSENTYVGPDNCNPCLLDDPYEGELVADMLTVFREKAGLTDQDITDMWTYKLKKVQKATLTVEDYDGSKKVIDAQRGWWFSAHEQWKYIMLPYSKSDVNWRVFLNGEIARTWYGATGGRIGLWASVTGPTVNNTEDGGYISDCGITDISFNQALHDNFITPYGAFPVILADKTTGISWLHSVMASRKGQNCYGATEGLDITGTKVAALCTWDTKITTVMALMGGVADITGHYLSAQGLLDSLVAQWDQHWGSVFGTEPLRGSDLPFRTPTKLIPEVMDDFTSCTHDKDFASCGISW